MNDICKNCDTRIRLGRCEGLDGDFTACFRPAGSVSNIIPENIVQVKDGDDICEIINSRDMGLKIVSSSIEIKDYGPNTKLVLGSYDIPYDTGVYPIGYLTGEYKIQTKGEIEMVYNKMMSIYEINKLNEGGDQIVDIVINIEEDIDWFYISSEKKLSDNFIRRFADYINWDEFFWDKSKNVNISEDLMLDLARNGKGDIGSFATSNNATERFIREFIDEIIEDGKDYNNGKLDCGLRDTNKTSDGFIKEFKDKVDWDIISEDREMSQGFIEEMEDYINFQLLAGNKKVKHSVQFLHDYRGCVDWGYIMENYEHTPDLEHVYSIVKDEEQREKERIKHILDEQKKDMEVKYNKAVYNLRDAILDTALDHCVKLGNTQRVQFVLDNNILELYGIDDSIIKIAPYMSVSELDRVILDIVDKREYSTSLNAVKLMAAMVNIAKCEYIFNKSKVVKAILRLNNIIK